MSGIFEANVWLLVDTHIFNIMGFPIAVCLCNRYIGWRLNTQDFHFNKKLYHDWLAMVYGRL